MRPDRRTDRGTDGRTDGHCDSSIPLPNFVAGGIKMMLSFSRRSDGRYGFEKYFKLYCVLHSPSNEN